MTSRRTAQRDRHNAARSVRTHAGVADQDSECEHGTVGCPGPGTGTMPCLDCFVAGGDSQ